MVGSISARGLFTSRLAHDLLYIRQVARILYEAASDLALPYDLAYAGDI